MRHLIAKILFVFFVLKVKREARRIDSVLSIYGHDISKENFEVLIKWLIKRGYQFLTPYELYDYLKGKMPERKKYVWMSFDDGRKSNYEDVFPILKKYKIPAAIFVATKGIEDGFFWFDKAFANRKSPYYKEIQELWDMPNEQRARIVEKLQIHSAVRRTMTVRELKEMTDSGLVFWGNHTDDHVMSDHCTEEELRREILTCQKKMRAWTGQDCDFVYSYPNGNRDERSEQLVKAMGFGMATTTEMQRIFPDTDCYRIPRMEFKDVCIEENVLHIYGIWTPFFNVIKKILGIRNVK